MTLRAIEKYLNAYDMPAGYPWVRKMMDEVEAEVDERYMLLPLDADGVPIRIGDEMTDGKVAKLIISDDGEHSVCVYKQPDVNVLQSLYCYETAHVKPDAVKVLLEEFDKAARDIHTTSEFDELMDEYAERIREAVSA